MSERRKKRGFSDLKPKTGNNDSLRLDELIEMYHFPKDEWCAIRFLDKDILPVKRHWIKILTGKDKKETKVPRFCVAFDPETEDTLEGVHCPYCDLSGGQDGSAQHENFYLVNAIIRELQEEEPAKKARLTKEEEKTGYKDIRSKSWTPVRVLRVVPTLAARLQELGETNIVKKKNSSGKVIKKAFDVSDDKYGIDINIKFKPKASGSDKYSADKSDDGRSPLTEEEMEYLTWSLPVELLDQAGRLSPKQAAEDFKRMEIVGGEEIDDEEDEDDDDLDLGSRKRRSKKTSAKKRSRADYDMDEDDEEDEDDIPPRSRRKKSSAKKRSRIDDDMDEDDEDDDDEPPRKRRSKKPAAKKRSRIDDDEDDDFDEEDEDDDDEPPRRRKKTSAKKSRRSAFDDDEDEDEEMDMDDDEEDEDEDDEPPRRRKKTTAKKRSRVDEDDDDEDDEDDDEPPRRRKKSTKSKKSAADWDDDDDDDWDDED